MNYKLILILTLIILGVSAGIINQVYFQEPEILTAQDLFDDAVKKGTVYEDITCVGSAIDTKGYEIKLCEDEE